MKNSTVKETCRKVAMRLPFAEKRGKHKISHQRSGSTTAINNSIGNHGPSLCFPVRWEFGAEVVQCVDCLPNVGYNIGDHEGVPYWRLGGSSIKSKDPSPQPLQPSPIISIPRR
jgi:hypothetical protein